MSKWLRIDYYKKLYLFVGPLGTRYLFFGVGAGLLYFISELSFAYVLQMFLVVMKIVPMTLISLPSWIPSSNIYLFLGFITITLFARGFVQWLNNFLISASAEIQREHQRYRLVEWALRATSVSSSELVTLYNQGIEEVSTVLTHIQSMSINLATASLTWLFMLKVSTKTTLISTGVLGFVALFSQLFNKYSSREGRKLATRMENINLRLLTSIKNLLLVQIYGTQEKEKKIISHKLSESKIYSF
jgi:ABC-type transport system involved in cytochrome bd biosynthesis fused ATPase/permease subunit